MINYELNFPLKDPSTVVIVNTDAQTATVSDPTKAKNVFTVAKASDNSPFFHVYSDYVIPNNLSGHYSSVDKAVEACCAYLKNSKQTFAVKSDELDKARKERNASKCASKSS